KPAFFDGLKPPTLHYRFESDRRIGLRIVLVRRQTGRVVRDWVERKVSPFGHRVLRWNGVASGHPAPDGTYQFRIGRRGGYLHPAGEFDFHGHFYPVRGPHWDRGYWGQ